MVSTYKQIVICDPRLKNRTCHFWETTQCFKTAAEAIDFKVEILGCEALPEELSKSSGIKPFFSEKYFHCTWAHYFRIRIEEMMLSIKKHLGFALPVKIEIIETTAPSIHSGIWQNAIEKILFSLHCGICK